MVLAGMLPTMAISYDLGLSEDSVTMPIVVFAFVGLPYPGKDIVFRFIIEYYSSLRDFGP